MIEALGNVGDFLGGIGVVITLIYLASQIRQNTNSARMIAFQSAQRDISEIIRNLSTDPELIRIYFDGNRDYESFSKEERRRYAVFMTGLLRHYETLIHQTRLGNIDQEQWGGLLEELRTLFSQPGARAWWALAEPTFNHDLRDFFKREIFPHGRGDSAAFYEGGAVKP